MADIGDLKPLQPVWPVPRRDRDRSGERGSRDGARDEPARDRDRDPGDHDGEGAGNGHIDDYA